MKLEVLLSEAGEVLSCEVASGLGPNSPPEDLSWLVIEDAKRFGAGVDWGFAGSGSDVLALEVDAPSRELNGFALAGLSGV